MIHNYFRLPPTFEEIRNRKANLTESLRFYMMMLSIVDNMTLISRNESCNRCINIVFVIYHDR